MLYTDWAKFKKKFKEAPPAAGLLLAKEPSARENAFDELIDSLKVSSCSSTRLTPENFSMALFKGESSTPPFLTAKKALFCSDVDRLSKEAIQSILTYLASPSPWFYLLLSASQMAPRTPLYEWLLSQGAIVQLEAQKPWEREKMVAQWLLMQAEEQGIKLNSTQATFLMRSTGGDKLRARRELEKLACYLGSRKEVLDEDLHSLCYQTMHSSLWQLGDLIWEGKREPLLYAGRALLDEGISLFAIFAFLRTQLQLALKVLFSHKERGITSVEEYLPYFQGARLEKRIESFVKFGERRLKRALLSLDQIDLQCKNSSIESDLALEMFLIKLMSR